MKRRLNYPRLLEGCASLLLGLLLFWLGLSGAYRSYVTPRTLPYLYFAGAILSALAVSSFARRYELCHIRRYTPYLVLIIPLLLLIVSISQQNLWNRPLIAPRQDDESIVALQGETYTMKTPAYAGRELHGYDPAQRRITIPDSETYWWLTEIYNDPTPFIGFTVQTLGQTLKDPHFFPKDCFSPTRQLMTCCVADLYTIGFKCQYDQAQALSEGSWVRVTGRLSMVDSSGAQELRLIVETVEPCDAPLDPYVYAY